MGTDSLSSQRSRRRRRVLAGVCAAAAIAGLVVVGAGLRAMDLATVTVGLVMTLGAVAIARAFRAIARTKSALRETNRQLEGMRAELAAGDAPHPREFDPVDDELGAALIDMVALGQNDPRLLTAATLSESTFPRLATLVNEAAVDFEPDAPAETDDGDIEPGPPKTQTVEDRQALERRLRREFSQRARRRDYAGLLEVGRRICAMLPGRPIAAEFERLRPMLVRKAESIGRGGDGHNTRSTPGAIVFDHPKRANA